MNAERVQIILLLKERDMTRYNRLNPYFVGFDRLFQEFDNFPNVGKPYPPHNLVKKDLDGSEYALELAVAGYGVDDIKVEVKECMLIVEGSKPTEEYTYLHKGISTKNFKREFKLTENMVVDSADLVNGILVIEMHETIPEEKRPRSITIGKK